MVLFNAGKLDRARFVGIRKVQELRGISCTRDCVEIGAAVTYSELRVNPIITSEFPLLAQAAGWTGSVANQNRGTLGGNIGNASPAADSSPVLLVYDAELKLVSSGGARWVPYSTFHLGYKRLALQGGELIAAIRLSRGTDGMVQYGRKVGTRKAQAISKVCLAATARDGKIRIGIGSVAPVPVRCLNTEMFLEGAQITVGLIEAAKGMMRRDISPITDIRSTGDYRLTVAENLLGEFLERLL
jgi:CO/xanthine dehydrogenase FAD-binding subunit